MCSSGHPDDRVADGRFSLRPPSPTDFLGDDGVREYCAYRELIQTGHPAQTDLLKARRHVTELAKRLAYL